MSTETGVVRLFVSSTFVDMHAERDRLNRFVFPELRSRCRRRGADFVGVDLRWGVPAEDLENAGAVDLCLAEIDRCRPFFLALLGDRYGWVPPPNHVPAVAFEQAAAAMSDPDRDRLRGWYRRNDTTDPAIYELEGDADAAAALAVRNREAWRDAGLGEVGRSITELEISRAIREAAPGSVKAVVCLRAPGVDRHPGFPAAMKDAFREPDPALRAGLDALKERLRVRSGSRLRLIEYEARFAGMRLDPTFRPDTLSADDLDRLDDGVLSPEERKGASPALLKAFDEHGTVALSGLDAWSERVVEALWEEIEPTLPAAGVTVATGAAPDDQRRFVARLASTFIGRDAALDSLVRYVASDTSTPLVITGPPGSGKSALLAAFVQAQGGQLTMATCFVGASSGSTEPLAVIRSLCEQIRDGCGIAEEIAEDPEELFHQLHLFAERGAARRPLLIVVDALDQISGRPGEWQPGWLPLRLPAGCRMVVSTLAGPWLERLTGGDAALVELAGLDPKSRREIVRRHLRRRGKRLTDTQIDRLLDSRARPDAELPLYLLVALEELSLFGSFADLEARIDGFPPRTPELFDQVLSRLHHDHGGKATELVLRALAASRAGLLESEVLGLCGRRAGLTPIRWGYLYRALEPYLQPLDERSRTGLLGFAHNQVREAVHRRYFELAGSAGDPRDALEATHGELADYFADGRAPDAPEWADAPPRALSEWPFHLAGAVRQAELRAALVALPFLQAKTASLGPRPLLADYDLVTGHERGDESLAPLRRALRLSAQILHDDPDELAPQLCARLGRDASGPMASLWRQIDEKPGTWLRPRLRTADPGAGRELGRLRGINMLHCLAASPDGTLAATGAERGSIEIWDLATAVRRRLITSDEGWMSAAVGHPREPVAYVGATSGNVYRIDLVAGIITHRLGDFHVAEEWSMPSFDEPDPTVRGLDVSADGSLLVVGHEDGTVRLWDTSTHAVVREIGSGFDDDNPLRGVALRPSGDGLLCAGDHLDLVDLDGALVQRRTWTGGRADAVACSASLAATGHDDGAIRLWALADPGTVEVVPRHRTGGRQGVTALAFNASGDRLVSVGADKRLCVTALPGGASVLKLGAHSMAAYDVALLDDGRRAISCGKDSLLKTWDLAPGGGGAPAVPELEGEPHAGQVEAVAVADDGGTAVSGGTDALRVWSIEGRRLLRELAGHGGKSVVAVALSTVDREVRSLGQDGLLRRWNLDRGRRGTSTRVTREGPWEDVALRADGLEALAVRKPTQRTAALAIQRHGRSRASRVVPLGDFKPTEVTLSPTGRLALAVDLGSRLRLIDLTGRQALWTGDLDPGHADFVVSMAIAADERFAVLGFRRGAVEAWDLVEGTRLHRSEFHAEMVEDVALTGDGELTCSASWETLRLWHTRTGRPVASFHGEYDWSSCAITPDGTTVVAGDTNGTVHFLEVANARRGR